MKGIDILLLQILLILDNKKIYNIRILLQSIKLICQLDTQFPYQLKFSRFIILKTSNQEINWVNGLNLAKNSVTSSLKTPLTPKLSILHSHSPSKRPYILSLYIHSRSHPRRKHTAT